MAVRQEGKCQTRRRLKERGIEFEQAVNLLSRTLTNQGLVSNEAMQSLE